MTLNPYGGLKGVSIGKRKYPGVNVGTRMIWFNMDEVEKIKEALKKV